MTDCQQSEDTLQGILLPWNPYFEPETIRVHVEAHRASPDRLAWWGRFGMGKSQEFSLGPVERAFELLSTDTTRRPVFVTDFVRLHALKVDAVTRDRPADACADYYAKKPISMWLRFRDLRVLSHNQTSTLHILRDEIRDERMHSCRGIDPYASMTQLYPRIISAQSNDVLFDPAGAPKTGYYADAKDVVDQPITEEAFRRLSGVWGDATWGRLAHFSQECLAQADVLFRDEKYGLIRRDDVDPAAVLLQLARALERELVTETLSPLVTAARHEPAGSESMATLRDLFAGIKGEPTLGSFVHVFVCKPAFAKWIEGTLREGPAVELACSSDWHRWLDNVGKRRNATLHPREGATCVQVRELAEMMLDAGGSAPKRVLDTITGAKEQLRGVVARTEGGRTMKAYK